MTKGEHYNPDFEAKIERGRQRICIRPEVTEKIEAAFENKVLDDLRETYAPDFKLIKANLYPYQKEGIHFALFRRAAIIAELPAEAMKVQATEQIALFRPKNWKR